MSKPSKRANREERKADKKKLLASQKLLREQQKKDGTYQPQTSVSNKISTFKTMDEEYQGREEAVDAQLHVFRAMLPIWADEN